MQHMFKSIGSTRTLGQEIVEMIEQNILDRKLVSGQKLPTEKELGEMFGVSRTALREALQMLSAKGLITIRKGSGIYVNDFASMDASKNLSLYLELNFDKAYALHLVHVRQIYEPEIARLAATHRTDADLDILTMNLEAFSDENISSKRHAELDLEFHSKIAAACGNPIIFLIMEPIINLMPKIKSLIFSKVRHNVIYNALDCHQKIFDQIKARNPEGAAIAMRDHLKIAEQDTLKLIEALETEAD